MIKRLLLFVDCKCNVEIGEIYNVLFVPKVIYIRLTSWDTRECMFVHKDSYDTHTCAHIQMHENTQKKMCSCLQDVH